LGAHQASDEVIETLIHSAILRHNCVSLPREGFVFALLRSHTLVFQQIGVSPGQLFQERSLFMIGLQYTILMWSELLQLSFEQLRLLIRNGFLVEDEYVRDVVRVNLF